MPFLSKYSLWIMSSQFGLKILKSCFWNGLRTYQARTLLLNGFWSTLVRNSYVKFEKSKSNVHCLRLKFDAVIGSFHYLRYARKVNWLKYGFETTSFCIHSTAPTSRSIDWNNDRIMIFMGIILSPNHSSSLTISVHTQTSLFLIPSLNIHRKDISKKSKY